MPVGKKFPDFQLASQLTGGEFLVGYNADATSEIRASIQTVANAIDQTDHITSKTLLNLDPNQDTTLDTVPIGQYDSVKYIIDLRNSSTFCCAEALVTTFANQSYMTTYAILGNQDILNLSATVSGSNIILKNQQTSLSGLSATIVNIYIGNPPPTPTPTPPPSPTPTLTPTPTPTPTSTASPA